jgi:hypothetical protein
MPANRRLWQAKNFPLSAPGFDMPVDLEIIANRKGRLKSTPCLKDILSICLRNQPWPCTGNLHIEPNNARPPHGIVLPQDQEVALEIFRQASIKLTRYWESRQRGVHLIQKAAIADLRQKPCGPCALMFWRLSPNHRQGSIGIHMDDVGQFLAGGEAQPFAFRGLERQTPATLALHPVRWLRVVRQVVLKHFLRPGWHITFHCPQFKPASRFAVIINWC